MSAHSHPLPTAHPLMYGELAEFWPILSPPEDYRAEAIWIRNRIRRHLPDARTILELGSGGGNNALHLKRWFDLTLVDLSRDMLAVSRRLNPECRHRKGDMRTVRLRRRFDVVLIHDALLYLHSDSDLRRTLRTVFLHTRPGGMTLLLPDYVTETWEPATHQGGDEDEDSPLRYLEWTWDPTPGDGRVTTDFVYALRDPDGSMRVLHDRHEWGVFSRQSWLDRLRDAGFEPHRVARRSPALEPGARDVFVGLRRTAKR